MEEKLTQTIVDRWIQESEDGRQFYDSEAKGLRPVIGKTGGTYKHVSRISRRGGCYVTGSIGRAAEVSLRQGGTLRAEVRLAVKQGVSRLRRSGSGLFLN